MNPDFEPPVARRSAVVLGARHLGGALIDRLVADGWAVAGVARRAETLTAVEARGAVAISADAESPEHLEAALTRAGDELGGLDLIVNAISVGRPLPGEPFGGGPIAAGSLKDYRRWSNAVGELTFTFLVEGARALRRVGGGTLVQITNATARRPQPGAGMWSAGHHALSALVETAAEEFRPEGIRVALLRIDGPIRSPKSEPRLIAENVPDDAVLDQREIAAAFASLVAQEEHAFTYELALTAIGRPVIAP